LHGEANDHVGKGLSGGRIIVTPPEGAGYDTGENVIIGNVALYGATSGEVYINGVAGERFCVRNSGATAVVEGIGDHGCEYMTGGYSVILGPTGKNFGAGMSGGIAYVYDPASKLEPNANMAIISLTKLEDDDADILRGILENHISYTGSRKAKAILDDFETSLPSFVKVIPNAYRDVLNKMREAAGKDIFSSEGKAPEVMVGVS
ncbi:MAG: hypothetical protein LBS93_01430, partial [Synergistaceae bacterium]|nr:hypothetical protein [Synergistaceae bacterium]